MRLKKSLALLFCIPLILAVTWTGLTALHVGHFDKSPFILLNLMFSTQAAYAAPLILLAQTRQADRDKARSEADAQHREEIAAENQRMLEQNTELTEQVAKLTAEVHQRVMN